MLLMRHFPLSSVMQDGSCPWISIESGKDEVESPKAVGWEMAPVWSSGAKRLEGVPALVEG